MRHPENIGKILGGETGGADDLKRWKVVHMSVPWEWETKVKEGGGAKRKVATM